MSAPRVTVATIFREAKLNGWRDAGDAAEVPCAGARFNVTAPGAWSPNAGRRPIWRGRLAEGDLAAIIAPPYAGKSLVAPFIAWRLSQGTAAFGRPTVATSAAWFAVEDSHGAVDRMEALRRTWGDAPGFRLVTPDEGGFSLLRDADVDALAALVAREGIGVLVLDTLSAAAPGHRENDVEAVSQTIARLRRITRAGCTVVVTHHVAKSADSENPTARGSGDLQAAFDFVIALAKPRDADEVKARIVKNRNGPPEAFGFRLGVVDLGAVDRWGEPICAPVLSEELSAAEAGGGDPRQDTAAAKLLALLDSLGAAVPYADLASAATACGILSKRAEKLDSRQATFRRALRTLIGRGIVAIGDDGVVRLKRAEADAWPEGEE